MFITDSFVYLFIIVITSFVVGPGNATVKLYYAVPSPPSRSVMAMLKLLGIEHELLAVDVFRGEAQRTDYAKMNPQHTIPVLDDNEFFVIDSHAINAYLASVYAKDDKLYPEDPKARSVVNYRLFFDTGVLFPAYKDVVVGYRSKTLTGLTREIVSVYEENYGICIVENFLKNHLFIAGDEYTIADLSTFTSLTSMEIVWPPNAKKYPRLVSYLERCRADIPHLADVNDPGIAATKNMILKGFNFNLPYTNL